MRHSLALVLAVVFSSAPAAMAQVPSGKIVFYREARSADSIFIPAFFCDGIQLGRVPAGSYQEVSVPAGKHDCSVDAVQRQAISIDVPAAGTVYVLMRITGGHDRHGVLTVVMEADYKRETKLIPAAAPIRLNGSQQIEPGIDSETKPSHTGIFGELEVTATAVDVQPGSSGQAVTVSMTVVNTGTSTICSRLAVQLDSAFGDLTESSKDAPDLSELGPREKAVGRYDFTMPFPREPAELSVELANPVHCGHAARRLKPGPFSPGPITINLRDLPGSASRPSGGTADSEVLFDMSSATKQPATGPGCLYCPQPQYTEDARRGGFEGVVTLKVVVGKDGRARDLEVTVSSGYPNLDQKAVDAVKGWRFKPALDSNGMPVNVITPITITFRTGSAQQQNPK